MRRLARAEPFGDALDEPGLSVERHVDEGVPADDGVEGTKRKAQAGDVSPDERGAGNERAGALDPHLADVHAGHPVPGGGEDTGDRQPAAAPDVQDVAARGKTASQVGQPAEVLVGASSSPR
jgi:hypothetical protein